MAFLAIFAILLFKWFSDFKGITELLKKNDLAGLNDLKGSAKSISVWLSIFFSLLYGSSFPESYKKYDFFLWLKNRNHCGQKIIERTLSLDFECMPSDELKHERAALEMVLEGEIHQKNLAKRNGLIAELIFDVLNSLLTAILIYQFLIHYFQAFLDTHLKAYFNSSIPKFDFFDGAFFIGFLKGNSVFIFFYAAFIVYNIAFDIWRGIGMNRAKQDWISKNAPDKAEIYKKYFKNTDNYLIDRKFSDY